MGSAARRILRASMEAAGQSVKLQESYDAGLVNEIFRHSVKKQTGVSLKYMLDFGQKPIEKQILLSAQFLQNELPIRLAHRVAELENLPFGLSSMKPVLKVRTSTLPSTASIIPTQPLYEHAADMPRTSPACMRLSHAAGRMQAQQVRLTPHLCWQSRARRRLQVRDWYVESFRELKALPPIKDTADELRFTGLLKSIYQRHAHVVPTMARCASWGNERKKKK